MMKNFNKKKKEIEITAKIGRSLTPEEDTADSQI